MLIYKGKAGNMTWRELRLAWKFGLPVEPLEPCDFSKN